MIYGHGTRASPLSSRSGCVSAAALTPSSSRQFWRQLDREDRLALVERTLNPAKDMGAGHPVAL